jgi:hypothetical protein
VLYAETKGLVLNLNVIKFSISDAHSGEIPRRCYQNMTGSHYELQAFEEALLFIRRFITRDIHPNLTHVQLETSLFRNVKPYLEHFNRVMSEHQDLHIDIDHTSWILDPLSNLALRRMKLLEEEGEPFDTEDMQMQQRIQSHMQTGKKVHKIVKKKKIEGRNWRVFPENIAKRKMVDLSKFLTGEQQAQVKDWQGKGL